jgi:WD40 repeat protein
LRAQALFRVVLAFLGILYLSRHIYLTSISSISLNSTIRSPRGSSLALGSHHVLKDVVVSANGDGSFSLWDTSSGKEIHDQPYAGCRIGSISLSPQGNAFITADDLQDACLHSEKGELRMWALRQPPTMEEILENDRIKNEYRMCAQALAACNPAGLAPCSLLCVTYAQPTFL